MTTLRLSAPALTACLVLGLTGTARAADPADPEAAREEARRQRDVLTADLDVLQASELELQAAASALSAELRSQEDALEASERAVEAAEADVRRAEGELARTREEIDRLTDQLVDRAVRSFVAPERSSLYDVAVSANFTDAARKQAFIAQVLADEAALVDDLDEARERLEVEQSAAATARVEAGRRRTDNVERLAALEATAEDQARVEEAIATRSADVVAEIDALAATEAQLTALIEQRAREQREAEERARAAAEAEARERAAAEARAREEAAAEARAREEAAAEARAREQAAADARAREQAATDARSKEQAAARERAQAAAGARPTAPADTTPGEPRQSPTRRSSVAPSTATGAGGCTWPVRGVVTSEYGSRWGRLHAGIDIAAPTGTPIHAARAGTVLVADDQGGYGLAVVIDHGSMTTLYGHQSRLAVRVGDEVGQGEVIGYVGSTGHSTGPHLHFETRIGGSPVNPRPCLP